MRDSSQAAAIRACWRRAEEEEEEDKVDSRQHVVQKIAKQRVHVWHRPAEIRGALIESMGSKGSI